jgi:hypothetical protein
MILAAVAHSVPVIVRSMPPEVVKSLPPVSVLHMPPPDFGSVLLSVAGIVIALAALVVASITLQRVNRQITIATEELDAVKKDFKLSQDQFVLNQEQFDLSQKQFGEIMRRPRLDAQMVRFGEPNAFDTFSDNRRPRIVTLSFFVTNSGDAVARDVLVEIFVPLDQLEVFNNRDRAGGFTPILDMIDNVKGPDGVTYGRFVPRRNPEQMDVVYPKGGNHMAFWGCFLFRPDCESTQILWRAFDQFTVYPQEGQNSFPELRLTP